MNMTFVEKLMMFKSGHLMTFTHVCNVWFILFFLQVKNGEASPQMTGDPLLRKLKD